MRVSWSACSELHLLSPMGSELDDATGVMFWTCGLHGCVHLVKIQ